ncbi:MAG: RNA polymerase sigma factor [bacterium]|nr:RNA polymerase sigma factor [bacterium]
MTAEHWTTGSRMAWRDVEDEALLDRAASGEPAAVDAFVERFGERLCGFLVRLVRDRAWAEDLVQEVLVRALHEAHRYDPEWPVPVWLFAIARNLGLDLLRREGRRRKRASQITRPDVAPAAVTTAEHREFQIALEDALQQLPEPYRTVFLLRDGESMSYEAIGEVLGISPKTVSSRLHRARSALRVALKEHLPR